MNENDTILLLRECDSGLKMAISSLDEVLDVIKNKHFKNQCIESKNKHQTLKKEIDQLLKENNIKEKLPLKKKWKFFSALQIQGVWHFYLHTRNIVMFYLRLLFF